MTAPATLDHLRSNLWPALEVAYNLPTGILEAIAHTETGGTFRSDLSSGRGARGMFQLMPVAIEQIRRDTGVVIDPANPYQASFAAALLLARMNRLFYGQLPLMVAAYNAGEGRIRRFVADVQAQGAGYLPVETKTYIRRVTAYLGL